MTFLSAWRLVLLLAPIALLVAYVLVQRRRHTQVVRFTSVDLLDSVAPKRSGWQRHVPAAGALLSLVVLTLAFAQPVMALPTPRDKATILLALDTSASMAATDVAPNRLAAAEEQARAFVRDLPDGVQVGLVTFDTSARLLVPPTDDHARVIDALTSLDVGPGTATADGIRASLAAVEGARTTDTGERAQSAIVLMSDGTPTVAPDGQDPVQAANDAAAEAKQAGVPIDTIAFGTAAGVVTVQGQDVPVPTDVEAMATIARLSGGRSFTAETAGQLAESYAQIGSTVAYEVKTQEVTAYFAGIALLLAVAAAAGGLVWNQRLV
ncbi:MAG: VWA domain-containing protein [Actinomycetales bacterium]|nr:VWA domain-containing protein [Actinomycetales bacterium]